jgi:hypothetical protein
MKQVIVTIFLLASLAVFGQTKNTVKTTTYTLIKATKEPPGEINQSDINKLDEPLRAIAAYYSGLGGSNCTQDTNFVETCFLTDALGLGNQGSEKHKALLKKWFIKDKAAKQLIDQDCYQRPSGASSFSDYTYLALSRQGDTVTINYRLMLYDHGKISYIRGPDKVVVKGNQIQVLKRSIWKNI